MKNLFNEYVKTLETYIMFRIKQKTTALTESLTAKNRAPIMLSIGAPSDPPPQFSRDKLVEYMSEPGIHSYSVPKGEKFFLDAVREKMKRSFGASVENDEICSLIGSKEGIGNFIRGIINPTTVESEKEIIMVPDPGYASYKEMLKVSGGIAYSMPLTPENNFMPDLDEVWETMKKEGFNTDKVKAVILNYPNNPLGALATPEYFEKAIAFCKKHGIILLNDAAYIEMTFPGAPKACSVLKFEGAKDVAIEFHSFSKSYAMTGWRLGWACGNKELVGMLAKLKSSLDTGIFKLLQKAGAETLNSKEGDEYIEKSVLNYQKKQKILTDGLSKLGWDTSKLPQATFYLWLPIPPRYKTSEEFTDDLLEKSGIVVVPGNGFGKYGEGWFRVSVVAPDDKLYEAVERMEADGFTFYR